VAEPGGGTGPPMTRLAAPCTLGPPTLTSVDRNKAYCFHKLVLNLPAPLDIQWPKCFQLQGGFAPSPPDQGLCPWKPRWGLCPQTPVIGSCSALAMVPPNHWPLPPPMCVGLRVYIVWTVFSSIMLCACFLCKHVRLSCVFYNKLTSYYIWTLMSLYVQRVGQKNCTPNSRP